jgi:hypothetical protein
MKGRTVPVIREEVALVLVDLAIHITVSVAEECSLSVASLEVSVAVAVQVAWEDIVPATNTHWIPALWEATLSAHPVR